MYKHWHNHCFKVIFCLLGLHQNRRKPRLRPEYLPASQPTPTRLLPNHQVIQCDDMTMITGGGGRVIGGERRESVVKYTPFGYCVCIT